MLQRAMLLQINQGQQLAEATRELAFQVRTSGGIAGRDEALCAACDKVEPLLSAVSTVN